jgi:hypothetical protein
MRGLTCEVRAFEQFLSDLNQEARLMKNTEATGASHADNRIGRRTMLRRFGTAGLLATAGGGLSTLFGATSAKASAALPSLGSPPTNGSYVPGVFAPSVADCDACITCNRDEGDCPPGGGGSCASGSCCYYCSGCGYSYSACYNKDNKGCAILQFKTCPGTG